MTLESLCPAAQIKCNSAQTTGKDHEREAGLNGPRFLWLQDSAPTCYSQMFPSKNQHLSKTSIFSMLICESVVSRMPMNPILDSMWILSQPGVYSHLLSLWGLLGVPFLSVLWPPNHQAYAQDLLTRPSFPRTDAISLDGIKPCMASPQRNHLEVCFSGQHSNLKNVNQSKDERIL